MKSKPMPFCLLPLLAALFPWASAAQERMPEPADPLPGGVPDGIRQAVDQLTDIVGIKPPESIDLGWGPAVYLWGALAGFVLAALVAGGLFWWKKSRRQAVAPVPAEPADQVALRQLDDLVDRSGADPKSFYFHLSAILRGYIQARFGIDALEMTTEELLPRIDGLAVEDRWRREIRAFTLTTDPVKFADRIAHDEKMRGDMDLVRSFVLDTAPAPPEENQGVLNDGSLIRRKPITPSSMKRA